ncbi:MAG: amidohydrolase family protein [Proteobacteria bacterium]|nr:amidohydrolase family protein [Pseudomonadota bacterium]
MPSSLIRGRYVIRRVVSRTEVDLVEDGAVFQRDGEVVEVGPFADLSRKHRADEVIGSADHVVVPGFVNAHHHVGLTPLQLGSPDHPLELWFASRMGARVVDLYLDTLYSAFEMIASGITTVQHLHSRARGGLKGVVEAAGKVIKAYRDIGMRVSYAYGMRDQNRLVYGDDQAFIDSLPADIGPGVAEVLSAQAMPIEDYFALFEHLHAEYGQEDRVRIQLAPANLHWCSDRALGLLKECSERFKVPLHMHVLETAYQKEYARRRTGGSAVRYLHEAFGLLGPRMTMGHGVWLSEADIDLAAETGTCICHNCSSNLRLRSGVAPLNAFESRGVRVAIGLDEAGINDDRDMLQEMRLVLRLHRVPGMDDAVPTAAQVLRMATEHGAHTTPFGAGIGTLEPGRACDLSLVGWRKIAEPYLDLSQGVSVVEALIARARPGSVETVVVAGDPIYRDGRFTRIDKEAVLAELAEALQAPLAADEIRRRETARKVLPFVKRFYDGYLAGESRDPFYRPSSRS